MLKTAALKSCWVILLIAVCALGYLVWSRIGKAQSGPGRSSTGPAPVEVEPMVVGQIELKRTFSGTLESPASFLVAPKVSGRIEQLFVDLSDSVQRGQVVAELDNDEYEQAQAQAEAELAVAKANLGEAGNQLTLAQRERDRVKTLQDRGVASESQFDAAQADALAKGAALEVARAQVTRAEATLQTARIRLSYTRITANWTGGDTTRTVAQRLLEEGDTVAAGAPLMTIVQLDPLQAVIFVTEKDYASLVIGQEVTLATDAYPGRSFEGTVARVSPVFEEDSRQARIEITVANPEHLLKPGMFVRARVVLDTAQNAVIVPFAALTQRDNQTGLFVLDDRDSHVRWVPVQPGIHDGERVQVIGQNLTGRVVTLGQQLIRDGSEVHALSTEQAPANDLTP
ncbi:MAG: efflux RND transporter periplasmic adaptor subunit [Phycisphaera sp.]|nr:efflux RND transporter periplasmic adaptor subunit [Phycisphaera sp.]